MTQEQRLVRKDLEEVRDRLRQGPSDDSVNPPLASSFKTGQTGECVVLQAAISKLADEVSGLRAVQGQASDTTKRSGAVLSHKAPSHSASSDAGQRRRSLLRSQDLAPCVLIDRPVGSRVQAAALPAVQPTLRSEQASPSPSVEAAVALRTPAAASYMSQRRVAPGTPRVLPVRFQESQPLQQTADRGIRSSNPGVPVVDCEVAAAFEQGGALGSGDRESNNAWGSQPHDGNSTFDSAGGTLPSSELLMAYTTNSGSERAWGLLANIKHLDGHDEVGCGEEHGSSWGKWAGTDPRKNGLETLWALRADSEPLDGHGEVGSEARRGTRAGSEPWVRPGQKSMGGDGGGGSLSARGPRHSSWRWGRRGQDPTTLAYASQGTARFFHPPPPPPQRRTWAIEHGVDSKLDLSPLAMRLAAADASVTAGSGQQRQTGWVAALAAAMDGDEATDPGPCEQ
jgi:hypothetical protein